MRKKGNNKDQVIVKRPRNVSPSTSLNVGPSPKFPKAITGTKSGSFNVGKLKEEEIALKAQSNAKSMNMRLNWIKVSKDKVQNNWEKVLASHFSNILSDECLQPRTSPDANIWLRNYGDRPPDTNHQEGANSSLEEGHVDQDAMQAVGPGTVSSHSQ